MDDLTVEQWLEKSPPLKELSKSVLFVSREVIDDYKSDDTVDIGTKEISANLLKNILCTDEYYKYVDKLFKNEIAQFSVSYIYSGDIVNGYYLSKTQIVKGLEILIQAGEIALDSNLIARYDFLCNEVSFNKFIEKNLSVNFDIEIDGHNYSFPANELISFMQISDDDFDKVCSSSDIKTINGTKKEHFVYATYKYLIKSGVFTDYIVPERIENRFNQIIKFEKIDIEAINRINKIKDDNVERVIVNEKLKQAILSGLPQNVSQLERAIYIYIKMCKILSYDEEFYAAKQMGDIARKHENVENIRNITPENNRVVCYEFNAIYGKLLETLGIKFETFSQGLVNNFGGGHTDLKFRCGKFLINADAVTSILHGDMVKAKMNQPLVGLKCINVNTNTKLEFSDLMTKMYDLIVKQEENNKNLPAEHIETFDEVLSQYRKTVPNYPKITLQEKLAIMIDKINSFNFTGIDAFGYMLQLEKILFTLEERKNNIKISIFGHNINADNQTAIASAVLTINEQNNVQNGVNNIYYFYHPDTKLIPISLAEIQEKFDKGIFDYIDSKDPRIPGIIEKEMTKNAR